MYESYVDFLDYSLVFYHNHKKQIAFIYTVSFTADISEIKVVLYGGRHLKLNLTTSVIIQCETISTVPTRECTVHFGH
jgi:hypothetical protein